MTTSKFFGTRFKLRKLLGKGSLGHTFLAADMGQDNQEIALKILHKKFNARPSFFSNATQALNTAHSIQEPGIRSILEFGKIDEHLFYTMEYIPGDTLRNWLNTTTQYQERVWGGIEKVKQILDLVKSIHQHQKLAFIKPENISLLGNGQIILADYWIAPLIPSTEYSHNPEAQKYLPYFAPEIKEDWQQCSHQTDLYTLGALLHEILLGTPPEETPLLPSQCADIYTTQVDNILHSLLGTSQIARVSSTSEFLNKINELQNHLFPSTVEAPPQSINATLDNTTKKTQKIYTQITWDDDGNVIEPIPENTSDSLKSNFKTFSEVPRHNSNDLKDISNSPSHDNNPKLSIQDDVPIQDENTIEFQESDSSLFSDDILLETPPKVSHSAPSSKHFDSENLVSQEPSLASEKENELSSEKKRKRVSSTEESIPLFHTKSGRFILALGMLAVFLISVILAFF